MSEQQTILERARELMLRHPHANNVNGAVIDMVACLNWDLADATEERLQALEERVKELEYDPDSPDPSPRAVSAWAKMSEEERVTFLDSYD